MALKEVKGGGGRKETYSHAKHGIVQRWFSANTNCSVKRICTQLSRKFY
jgi:hypothetical protein